MNQFSYRPGSWQVVVEEGGVVAVPDDVSADRIERLSDMLQQGTPALTEVIDVLAAGSIAALGAFAVALTPGQDVRFAVRGPVTVRISGSAGAETVSGADVSTWSERYVAELRGFELELDEQPGAATYPIRSGVVLAGAVRAGEGADGDAVEEAPSLSVTPAPDAGPAFDAPPMFDAAPVLGDAGASEDAPMFDAVPAPDEVPAVDDAEEFDGVSVFDDLLAGDDSDDDAESAVDAPQDDAVSGPELQTLIPTELTFAPDPADALPASALEETVQLAPSAPASPPPPVGQPIDLPPPPVIPPMPPMPPAPPGAPDLGDHDGATISLAEVRRLRAEAGGPPVSPDAPTEMIPTPQAPATAHGRVRLSTGQVVELDRTVIIGRRPRSTRASGETMPHLVAVESPQQDISRSHLEIRPEGDSVVVIDLRTTNGSTLIRPGVDPMRLHPGEHTLVLDGDVVDLGDGVTVAFEGLA